MKIEKPRFAQINFASVIDGSYVLDLTPGSKGRSRMLDISTRTYRPLRHKSATISDVKGWVYDINQIISKHDLITNASRASSFFERLSNELATFGPNNAVKTADFLKSLRSQIRDIAKDTSDLDTSEVEYLKRLLLYTYGFEINTTHDGQQIPKLNRLDIAERRIARNDALDKEFWPSVIDDLQNPIIGVSQKHDISSETLVRIDRVVEAVTTSTSSLSLTDRVSCLERGKVEIKKALQSLPQEQNLKLGEILRRTYLSLYGVNPGFIYEDKDTSLLGVHDPTELNVLRYRTALEQHQNPDDLAKQFINNYIEDATNPQFGHGKRYDISFGAKQDLFQFIEYGKKETDEPTALQAAIFKTALEKFPEAIKEASTKDTELAQELTRTLKEIIGETQEGYVKQTIQELKTQETTSYHDTLYKAATNDVIGHKAESDQTQDPEKSTSLYTRLMDIDDTIQKEVAKLHSRSHKLFCANAMSAFRNTFLTSSSEGKNLTHRTVLFNHLVNLYTNSEITRAYELAEPTRDLPRVSRILDNGLSKHLASWIAGLPYSDQESILEVGALINKNKKDRKLKTGDVDFSNLLAELAFQHLAKARAETYTRSEVVLQHGLLLRTDLAMRPETGSPIDMLRGVVGSVETIRTQLLRTKLVEQATTESSKIPARMLETLHAFVHLMDLLDPVANREAIKLIWGLGPQEQQTKHLRRNGLKPLKASVRAYSAARQKRVDDRTALRSGFRSDGVLTLSHRPKSTPLIDMDEIRTKTPGFTDIAGLVGDAINIGSKFGAIATDPLALSEVDLEPNLSDEYKAARLLLRDKLIEMITDETGFMGSLFVLSDNPTARLLSLQAFAFMLELCSEENGLPEMQTNVKNLVLDRLAQTLTNDTLIQQASDKNNPHYAVAKTQLDTCVRLVKTHVGEVHKYGLSAQTHFLNALKNAIEGGVRKEFLSSEFGLKVLFALVYDSEVRGERSLKPLASIVADFAPSMFHAWVTAPGRTDWIMVTPRLLGLSKDNFFNSQALEGTQNLVGKNVSHIVDSPDLKAFKNILTVFGACNPNYQQEDAMAGIVGAHVHHDIAKLCTPEPIKPTAILERLGSLSKQAQEMYTTTRASYAQLVVELGALGALNTSDLAQSCLESAQLPEKKVKELLKQARDDAANSKPQALRDVAEMIKKNQPKVADRLTKQAESDVVQTIKDIGIALSASFSVPADIYKQGIEAVASHLKDTQDTLAKQLEYLTKPVALPSVLVQGALGALGGIGATATRTGNETIQNLLKTLLAGSTRSSDNAAAIVALGQHPQERWVDLAGAMMREAGYPTDDLARLKDLDDEVARLLKAHLTEGGSAVRRLDDFEASVHDIRIRRILELEALKERLEQITEEGLETQVTDAVTRITIAQQLYEQQKEAALSALNHMRNTLAQIQTTPVQLLKDKALITSDSIKEQADWAKNNLAPDSIPVRTAQIVGYVLSSGFNLTVPQEALMPPYSHLPLPKDPEAKTPKPTKTTDEKVVQAVVEVVSKPSKKGNKK